MTILTYTRANNLSQLHDEIISGVPALAPVPIPGDPNGLMRPVMTLSSTGDAITIEVPDATTPATIAEVDAVVAAHVPKPPPIQYVDTIEVDTTAVTTNDVALEVLRFPCEQLRLYQASLVISGVDRGTFASKIMEGRFTWKRTTANAVMVGITVVSDIHDTAAASWVPNALPQGTDIVFTVTGAAGRTIDWLLVGSVSSYAPAGDTGAP